MSISHAKGSGTSGLAWRIFRRDWRSGEVKILFFALMIAVTAMVAIGVITDRIHRAMGEQSSEFLGADYTFSSPRPIEQSWVEQGRSNGIEITETLGFSTVLSKGDKFQLVNVRAISGKFPLKGELEIADKPFTSGMKIQGSPELGSVWVEPRVLSLLGAKVGDKVDFGISQLTIAGVIVSGPGQASEVFNVAPRVTLNKQDVEAANIIQPGSRVSYGLFIAGELEAREQYIAWLKERKNTTQRITGGKEGTPALQASIERAETFLRLASLVSVVLAGVAIAVAAGRFSRRHYDYAAIYRCLGMQIAQVHRLYFTQLSIIGLIGSALGVALGLAIQQIIIMQFADYLPKPMVPIDWVPVLVGALSGLVVLIGFALPAFFQIARVSPLRVLRKELVPQPLSSWLIYIFAIVAMALLMWWQSGDFKLVGILLGVALLAYGLIRLIAWLIFKLGVWLGKRASTPIRYGLGQLKRYPAFTISQITAFGLAFIIMLSTVLIRSELLDEWQNQLPEGAPNHFLVNVQPQEVELLENILAEQSVQTAGIYPMVRGRVVGVNDQTLQEALDERALTDGAVRRELNLTWMTDVPKANQVTQGEWWVGDALSQDETKTNQLSIDEKLAERLGLKIGDKLLFSIGGIEVAGEISNFRSIQWDSFQPNFFIIFQPGALDAQSATYITSFHLQQAQKPTLNTILQQMPTVTIIELDAIMAQVQTILEQVTRAIEFIMLFVLLAGIAVLYAVLQSNRDERVLSATLLKTLGAQTKFIRTSLVAELALLGLFSGILGAIGGEVLVSALYKNALKIEPVLHPWVWIIVPLIGVVFISLVGWWGLRGLLKQPAHQVLRQM
ncbi:MAG: FtsX-like permease family protein [Kangiellaceae bacterium]|nr:FtsX-like permease family protein [Kangiellaceae bacterium]